MPLFGRFPVVKSHADVRCFAADDDDRKHVMQGDPRDDYALRHGRYSQACSCGRRTWYDLRPEVEK